MTSRIRLFGTADYSYDRCWREEEVVMDVVSIGGVGKISYLN